MLKNTRRALALAALSGLFLGLGVLPASADVVNGVLEAPNSYEHCAGFDHDSTNTPANTNPYTGTTYYPDVYVNSVSTCIGR